MYAVSDAFLTAVQKNTRHYYWTGKITTKSGAVYEFAPEDIVKGSGYISAQCCGSSELELGTVYSAEFGISLFSEINRYTLKDAKVEPVYHLDLGDGTEETVPMGIFEVSEANRTGKMLELKGYDYMLRFERDFAATETTGTAYDFISLCCKACSVEMAQTQAEIEALTNGTITLSIYPENDIETYRDCLFYVGQILAGFFVINREGKLELRQYGMTAVQTYKAEHRFSSSFSDFITRYTAISSTNKKTDTAEYYALDTDDALTMNLGVNPLLQFGTKDAREEICRNILNVISQIKYVPFDSETIGNPALDLGDVLGFSGGSADADQLAAITSIECRIGGKETFKCVGKNPLLAQSKSKNDKNIAGLLNQIEKGKIGIHTFTNAEVFTITDQTVRIVNITFTATEENHAQFFGQVILNVTADPVTMTAAAKGSITIPASSRTDTTSSDTTETTDTSTTDTSSDPGTAIEVELPVSWEQDGQAVAEFTFTLNGDTIEVHKPIETWHSGEHTILLYYPIEKVIPNYENTFTVEMKMSGGSAVIEAGNCIASIFGQSMAAEAGWDGRINIEQKIRRTEIIRNVFGSFVKPDDFTDTLSYSYSLSHKENLADSTAKIGIGAFYRPFEEG